MGIIYITLASIFFGSNPSVQNFVILAGLPSSYIAMLTMFLGSIFSLAACLIRGESLRLSGRQLRDLLLAGIIGYGVTEICLVTAYTLIPPGVATMVHFFFPSLVSIAMVLFFREKWTWKTGLAILLSIAGLFGIAGGTSGGNIMGVVAAAISSVSFGFYYILAERSSLQEIPPMAVNFYVHFFAGLASCALVTVRVEWMPVTGFSTWALLAASGLLGFLGYVCLNKGIPMIGAGIAAFINMLEPITSVVLSILFFHSRLSLSTCIGCALIVGAMTVRAMEKNPETETVS